MQKGKPAPQLLVLLWHHFIFYKRHWIKFLVTLLTPFMLFGAVYIFTGFLVDLNNKPDGRRQAGATDCAQFNGKYLACSPPIRPMFSNSPINYFLTAIDRSLYQQSDKSAREQGMIFNNSFAAGNQFYGHCANPDAPESKFVKMGFQSLGLECNMDITRSFDRIKWANVQAASAFINTDTKLEDIRIPETFKIYYTPQNEDTAKIMDFVNTALNQYQTVKELIGKKRISDPKNYTMGFKNLEALSVASREKYEKSKKYGSGDMVAAFEFDISSANYKYSILYDAKIGYQNFQGKTYYAYTQLQDIVERAIVRTIINDTSNSSDVPLEMAFKETPSKCWNKMDRVVYIFFPIPIALFIVISFLPCPSNFLHQALTEKELKLREYLYIVGVGSTNLKLSWILFYCIFLIPLSVAVALLVCLALPGYVWAFTNPIVIITIIIMYNISQLSLCCMLTNILKNAKHSTSLITFLHLFFTMIAVAQSVMTDFSGWKLSVARLQCLYPTTPLVFSLRYITTWEQQWQAVTTTNFFMSPVDTDVFGGVGECCIWLLFDICLYMLLAWYFEKIFPGEYGQKQPFYFPFKPQYWLPNKFKNQQDQADRKFDHSIDHDIESMNDKRHTAGVVLDKLTKIYDGGKTAVDHLSLTFYKNEITAFLGQNGAGKSTTMNCMVGVTTATSGHVLCNNMDMDTQMDSIRKVVGFVPQHDILYPSLTVEEHVLFFGWLKGMTKAEIKSRTDPILSLLGMDHLKTMTTTNLSGGQKRKLSIITGYLGFPEVIIFDEPTSGVDPASRRDIWELLLSHKKNNTTILSTHFMEEADIVGDRVAIIHQGQLKCAGSPMYLKQRFGRGMVLTIARNTRSDHRSHIIDFVTRHFGGSRLAEERGSDMGFFIPTENINVMGGFLEKLETDKNRLGILSYGISEPSLERVFFETISADEPGSVDSSDNLLDMDVEDNTKSKNDFLDKGIMPTTPHIKQRLVSIALQAATLFHKRILSMVFSWSSILLQVVLPFAFILLLLIADRAFRSTGKFLEPATGSRAVTIRDGSKENVLFVSFIQGQEKLSTTFLNSLFDKVPANLKSEPPLDKVDGQCPSCVKFCDEGRADQYGHADIDDDTVLYRLSANTNITEWMLSINQTGRTVIGGFLFQKTKDLQWKNGIKSLDNLRGDKLVKIFNGSSSQQYATVWYQNRFKFGILNLWNNIVVRMQLGLKSAPQIEMSLKGASLYAMGDLESEWTFEGFDVLAACGIIIAALFLALCFSFSTISSAVYVQFEITSGLKRLQMIYGVYPIVYWIVNYMFDFTLFCITCAVCCIPLVIFQNPYKPGTKGAINVLGHLTAVIIPYGYMMISFSYLISFIFEKTKTVLLFIVSLSLGLTLTAFIFSTLGTVQDATWFCVHGTGRYSWTWPINGILRIFPPFLMGDSIVALTLLANHQTFTNLPRYCNTYESFILSFDVIGKRQLMAVLMGTVYFVAVLLLESFDFRIDLSMVKKLFQKKYKVGDVADAINDVDVNAEKFRVGSHECTTDTLIVKNLVKMYPNMERPAVAGISFGVSASQCFGLLGLNGAGKTTTFKILTGYTGPTMGEALLNNQALFRRSWNRFKDSSYCPQENALFPSLTVEQHIRVFACFRAIPYSNIHEIMEKLINDVGLEDHRCKRAGQLSGGNQRKLQLALAMLDNRPMIFLDEPTTGMDPGARRKAWNLIKRATNSGCAVVLTSHSMEECEVLCHRLVIMVAGTFHCIGSVQYLKDKLGNKYTFKIKLRPQISDGHADFTRSMSQVKAFINRNVPSSELREEHATMLEFEVAPTEHTNLCTLFKALSKCRNEFAIEDISITQTTLEQLFINMSKKYDQSNDKQMINSK